MSEWEFQAPVWQWQGDGPATWRFVTLPYDLTDEIDDLTTGRQGGFGSVKVEVTIGATTWTTSVFPSKEQRSFILPVKAPVRKAEGLADGDTAHVTLRLVGFP
jgi:hypothetical protein